jgi:hypothetical protein
VAFGGVPATDVRLYSPEQMTAVAPAVQSADAVDVTVTDEFGATSETSPADQFTYGPDPVPSVSSVYRDAGPTAGSQTITVSGSGFVFGSDVLFGQVPASSVTFKSDQRLQVVTPAHTAGTIHVTVQTPGGTSTKTTSDLYAFGAPVVRSISSHTGPVAGGNQVTIDGSGFLPGATVAFGATGTAATFVSVNQLIATAPAHAAGTAYVRVSTSAGVSPNTATNYYAYGGVAVTSVSPRAGATSGGTTVTIKGSGFGQGATVSFGQTPASSVTFRDIDHLWAVAPAHAAGTVNVTVTTSAGTSPPNQAADAFAFGAPTVTSVSPRAGSIVGGGVIDVYGAGFVPGAKVWFGGAASPAVTFVRASHLRAKIPPHAAGTIDVKVQSAAGMSATSLADVYAFGPPTVTTIKPRSGPTAGGNEVTIDGTGFVPGVTVKFGTSTSPSVTVESSTQVIAQAPAHSAGSVDVAVHSPAGLSQESAGDVYSYGT